MDRTADRLAELQDWSREQGRQRFVRCLTCSDSGVVCAEQTIGNRIYLVTGGCPKCDKAPRGLCRLDATDPSIGFSALRGRPEPMWVSPSPASYYEAPERHASDVDPVESAVPVSSGMVPIWETPDPSPEDLERERNFNAAPRYGDD